MANRTLDHTGRRGIVRAACAIAFGFALSAAPAHAVTPAATTAQPLGLAAGGGHTCALTKTGGVKCWGSNSHGQLGINATGDRNTAFAVPNLTGILSISAGADHTCAVTKKHGLLCWGNNTNGELGINNTTNQFEPVAVHGMASGVAAVAAGNAHTCALMQSGAVKCWGNNDSGQLGDGAGSGDVLTPQVVQGLTGITAIGTEQNTNCVLTASKTGKCWGWNGSGQLGGGTKGGQSAVPGPVRTLNNALKLAVGGDHVCALTSATTLLCWGENSTGELGDGDTNSTTALARVKGLGGVALGIGAGGGHSCALIKGGQVRCWGNNVYGGIGDGTNTNATMATLVKTVSTAVLVSAGGNHSCALLSSGRIKCWGQNEFGELGNGTANNANKPVLVMGF